jgi:sporulation protein YlmC with PRC-barrel domain
VELGNPAAFSDLIGRRVTDPSGRALGRVFEAAGHLESDGSMVIDQLLLGHGALLRRLRGPGQTSRGIPWEAIVEIGPSRIVVRG